MVFGSQIKDFLHDFWRSLIGRVLWDRLRIDEPSFATLLIPCFPPIETGSTYAKVAASFSDVTRLLSMSQHLELAL